MMQQEFESLFQFPCPFPIKIMGEKNSQLLDIVKKIFNDQKIDLAQAEFTKRLSSGEKYVSITVIFTAESRVQLDELYQALTKVPEIKMVL